MSKDVLFVHAGFGEGHKRGALSLKKFFNADCCDLLDFCPHLLKKVYPLSYIFVTDRFPFLWKVFFYSTHISFINKLINLFHRYSFSSFFKYLRETKPKIIVTTHFFPIPLIVFFKKELNLKLISIVTDLRVHPLWLNEEVDFYFGADELTEKDLIASGIKKEKIISGFVPLREGFLKEENTQFLQEKFSLDNKPCILFVSSLRGRFPFIEEVINELSGRFNMIIIYGKNKRLKSYVEKHKFSSVKLFPFYEDMWELFSLSSVIVGKPGGLTVFEGIYKRKPFIFTHYIPGQEEGNMRFLEGHGVARHVRSKEEFIDAVNYFNKKSEELKAKYPIEVKDIRPALRDLIEKLR